MSQPYQLTSGTNILYMPNGSTGTAMSIPADLNNVDYQQYQAWLAEGNTPDPAPAPPQPTQQQLLEQQIAALEAQQTPRMYREQAVGSTVVNKNWVNPDGSFRTSVQQLIWLDQQIAPLRTQLQQLLSQNQAS